MSCNAWGLVFYKILRIINNRIQSSLVSTNVTSVTDVRDSVGSISLSLSYSLNVWSTFANVGV